jgi:hypothetical protein
VKSTKIVKDFEFFTALMRDEVQRTDTISGIPYSAAPFTGLLGVLLRPRDLDLKGARSREWLKPNSEKPRERG